MFQHARQLTGSEGIRHSEMGANETKVQVQHKGYDPSNLHVDREAGKPYFKRVERPIVSAGKKPKGRSNSNDKTMELQSVTEMP